MRSIHAPARLRYLSLFCLAALALVLVPPFAGGTAQADGGGDTALFTPAFSFGESSDGFGFGFGDMATCHITCANGQHYHEDVDDQQGCIDACNERCNTTTCQAPQ